MSLHVELDLPAGNEENRPPVTVGLVPLMLPVGSELKDGGAGDDGAGVAAAAGPGPVVSVMGAGAGVEVAGASEDKLGAATPGGRSKVVVAVGLPLASRSIEMMSEAVT